jgi:uncharacterized iron-regulated protein
MRCRAVFVTVAVVAAASLQAQTGDAPVRVIERARGQTVTFDAMVADLAQADVLFVGEQHDSAITHRLELAVLQGLARRRGDLILALEMFERDVQEPLDHFQMGHMTEDEFLKVSRPWPRYATDYKALVEFAIANNWPVIASNVPRPIAADVATMGLDILKTKSALETGWFAADLQCPTGDDYFTRFVAAMSDHPIAPGLAIAEADQRQTLERMYLAQCVKDETMGESVARAWQIGAINGRRPLVVHVNGAFHSDFGEGTAARAGRRLPGRRLVVLSILPVDNLDAVAPDGAERKRADYLVYTIK